MWNIAKDVKGQDFPLHNNDDVYDNENFIKQKSWFILILIDTLTVSTSEIKSRLCDFPGILYVLRACAQSGENGITSKTTQRSLPVFRCTLIQHGHCKRKKWQRHNRLENPPALLGLNTFCLPGKSCKEQTHITLSPPSHVPQLVSNRNCCSPAYIGQISHRSPRVTCRRKRCESSSGRSGLIRTIKWWQI